MSTVATSEPDAIVCPRCGSPIEIRDGHRSQCTACWWSGRAWRFQPVSRPVAQPQVALGDEATCVHHPDNKAVAVCEGTGDYICALCAATIGQHTYSVQYLDRVGVRGLGDALAPTLARPERMVMWMWLGSWLTVMFFGISAFAASGVALIYYVKMFTERARHPLYARLVGPARITMTSVYLLLTLGTAGLWIGLYLLMIFER